jgi:hypothetical protein
MTNVQRAVGELESKRDELLARAEQVKATRAKIAFAMIAEPDPRARKAYEMLNTEAAQVATEIQDEN